MFGKKNYHFLFLLLFDPQAFKRVKKTLTLFNLRVVPYQGLSVQTINNFGGTNGNFFLEIINYFFYQAEKLSPNKKLKLDHNCLRERGQKTL